MIEDRQLTSRFLGINCLASGYDDAGTVAKNYSELQKGYFLVLSA
ncbi:hypothetical protein [Piscirickettsia salmonis]|nr:hypothetical protein [Piscirickettsia salmonis]